MNHEQVLVIPRRIFDEYFALVPWHVVERKMQDIEETCSWLSRTVAERSLDWVQPIPCAFIRDSHGQFCVLRRIRNTRNDLKGRASLIVGGHIGRSGGRESFGDVLLATVGRELEEEVGIQSLAPPRPVGVIVDNSSILASRHIAFVHEVTASSISARAPEEFAKRSKLTGQFLAPSKLIPLRNRFDPWSRLLFEEFIQPIGVAPAPRQRSFLDDQY